MRNKRIAAILSLFLGVFGIHRLYLGQYLRALLYLVYPIVVLTVVFEITGFLNVIRDQASLSIDADLIPFLLLFFIIPVFDFIWLLAMSKEKFDSRYNQSKPRQGRAVLVSIAIAIVGILFNYLAYQQFYVSPSVDVEGESAAYSITSEKLAEEFTNEADSAKSRFSNNVIEVTGEVISEETQLAKGGDERVLILNGDGNFAIRCEFERSEQPEVRKVKVGEVITIKGSYREIMVFDVVLENCIIVNEN